MISHITNSCAFIPRRFCRPFTKGTGMPRGRGVQIFLDYAQVWQYDDGYYDHHHHTNDDPYDEAAAARSEDKETRIGHSMSIQIPFEAHGACVTALICLKGQQKRAYHYSKTIGEEESWAIRDYLTEAILRAAD